MITSGLAIQLQTNGIGDKAVAEPLSERYAFDIHLSATDIAKGRFGSNAAVRAKRPGYAASGRYATSTGHIPDRGVGGRPTCLPTSRQSLLLAEQRPTPPGGGTSRRPRMGRAVTN